MMHSQGQYRMNEDPVITTIWLMDENSRKWMNFYQMRLTVKFGLRMKFQGMERMNEVCLNNVTK